MTHARTVTVGLLWHSVNSDNLGVGALTASHVSLLNEITDKTGIRFKCVVLGWNEGKATPPNREQFEVDGLKASDFILAHRFFRICRKCDLIFDISAGDSFADIYGNRRILYNFLSKFIVLAARRKLILSPQTIGPFNKNWTAWIAKHLLRRSFLICTRDSLSSSFLTSINIRANTIEATDVAFRLPFTPPNRVKSDRNLVGLNVSGLLFNGGYTGNNMFNLTADYPNLIRRICDYFSKQDTCELHLIGHVNSSDHEIEDDYRVAEFLATEYPNIIVAPKFHDPSDAKTYISKLDFFMGARMHACIAAFSAGVPVVPMAYSRKFSGLFGSLGYPHVVDCVSQKDDVILHAIAEAFERRNQLKIEVKAGLKIAERRLHEYQQRIIRILLDAEQANQ